MKNAASSLLISCGIAVALLIAPNVYADTPESLEGTTLVSADKAKALLDGGAAVIDTRVAQEFAEGHIKGAKNVPYKEKSAKATDFDASQDSFDISKLPADKNAAIVLYCNGPECWKSYKASKLALKAGYKKIQWFRGGFPEWKSKGYPVE
ncbi:MAG: rhodanese-like domain-containing protein [Actinomycetota bacterium]